MKAIDRTNEIDIEIDDAVKIAGAIAILPSAQSPSYIGWTLMPDADYAEIVGMTDIPEKSPAEFLNDEGCCFAGDDGFNLWIESHTS